MSRNIFLTAMVIGVGLIVPEQGVAGLPQFIFKDPPTALERFEFQQWLPEAGKAAGVQDVIVNILDQSEEPLFKPISFLAEIIARDSGLLHSYLKYLRRNRAIYGHVNRFDTAATINIVSFLSARETESNFIAFARELGIEPPKPIKSSPVSVMDQPPQDGQKQYNAASGDWESYDAKTGMWMGAGEGKPEYLPRGYAETAKPFPATRP